MPLVTTTAIVEAADLCRGAASARYSSVMVDCGSLP